MTRRLFWLHDDALVLPEEPPEAALFVFDDALMARRHYGLKRIGFIYERLLALPVEIFRGDARRIVPERAAALGCGAILAWRVPCPDLTALGEAIGVTWLERAGLVDLPARTDLRRFSRYWQQVRASAMRPTAG